MAQDLDDEEQSPLPSNPLQSAIGFLKGRQANNNPLIATAENESAPKPTLTVISESVPEAQPYRISDDLSEGRGRQQLLELADENKSLTQALNISYASITNLEKQLAEANTTIASLMIQRTEGVENIIENLRAFQTGTANHGPIGNNASALKAIFSKNTELVKLANIANFNMKLEVDLRLALETLQIASGNNFSFDIDTAERPDFYKMGGGSSSDPSKIDPNLPAKLLIVDLKKTASTNNDVKIIVLGLKDKIFFENNKNFKNSLNKKSAFLNSTGRYDIGIFRSNNGQSAEYEDSGPKVYLKGPYSSIPLFIDELTGSCLTEVIGSNGFAQAARTLKTMGLMP